MKIEIYSTINCRWCVLAKVLLKSKGLDYEEINITSDHERRLEMVARSGWRTVPQIFIKNKFIGGYDELSQLSMAGMLC